MFVQKEYLRTEIAIVLDGSGSIDPPDFERAKKFIYDMMKTFYDKCFECVFALVQYGNIIKTEFDLRDGRKDGPALEKVPGVTQVCSVTRTASAIQHVLDSIFNPNYGSHKKAVKIIVVLTDGEILLDNLTLEAVIHSSSMAGIERYAIGVGEAFNKPKALEELRLIASDPDDRHLFRVTNYSALNVLLSTLQQKIIGIEGTAGDILEFELAQSGFSVHLLDENYILFGAVGAFDWSGGVLRYDVASGVAVFLNESKEETDARNGYLGYSVGSVKTSRGPLIVAGAPRRNMTGTVLVFEGVHLKQRLPGEQIGSYYGSELCTLDINKDGRTDYLLVGAPFFHIHGEEGKVYLYHLEKQTNQFAPVGHLRGLPAFPFARFGFAMADIGDFDANGFSDVAIGAPLEGHELNPGSSGSVYIFNGGQDGIRSSFSQRITAAEMGLPGLMYFGRSVSGGLDFTEDGLPDLVVGSLGNVVLLRSRPVLRLEPNMRFTPARISNFHNSSIAAAKLCFDSAFPLDAAQPGVRNLLVHYTVDLDVEMEKKRAQFEDHTAATSGVISYAENLCSELQLHILPCNANCFASIVLRLRYQLRDLEEDPSSPTAVLDASQDSELCFQLPYRDDCANKTVCGPRLSLAVQTEEELVVGFTKEVAMDICLQNSGDNSYMTSLVLEYPTNLHFKNIRERFLRHSGLKEGSHNLMSLQVSTPDIECDASKLTSLSCKVGHPVFKATTVNFSVVWQLDGKRFPGGSANITISVTNTNRNSTPLVEERSLGVKYAFSAILSRPVPILYVSASEGSPQRIHFTFNINGRNPFGAQLELRIWVPITIDNRQLTSIKEATGTQLVGQVVEPQDIAVRVVAGPAVCVALSHLPVNVKLIIPLALEDLFVGGKVAVHRQAVPLQPGEGVVDNVHEEALCGKDVGGPVQRHPHVFHVGLLDQDVAPVEVAVFEAQRLLCHGQRSRDLVQDALGHRQGAQLPVPHVLQVGASKFELQHHEELLVPEEVRPVVFGLSQPVVLVPGSQEGLRVNTPHTVHGIQPNKPRRLVDFLIRQEAELFGDDDLGKLSSDRRPSQAAQLSSLNKSGQQPSLGRQEIRVVEGGGGSGGGGAGAEEALGVDLGRDPEGGGREAPQAGGGRRPPSPPPLPAAAAAVAPSPPPQPRQGQDGPPSAPAAISNPTLARGSHRRAPFSREGSAQGGCGQSERSGLSRGLARCESSRRGSQSEREKERPGVPVSVLYGVANRLPDCLRPDPKYHPPVFLFQNSQSVRYQLVNCSVSSAKEDVTVTAELPLANAWQVLKNRTDLLVQGEIVFNSSLYVGLNTENHKAEITVVLLKEETFDFLPVIVGSSVGGFMVLIFIIFLLYKCGFFKRNYKAMMEEQGDS
ncbi:integrin alpha-E [Elgaria multicarinata webbii]|uniref:integrin alpha-E n=1 Tax=Elgaria multicarinata webbii TaxID=159646 RepID=UPI002FCD151A